MNSDAETRIDEFTYSIQRAIYITKQVIMTVISSPELVNCRLNLLNFLPSIKCLILS